MISWKHSMLHATKLSISEIFKNLERFFSVFEFELQVRRLFKSFNHIDLSTRSRLDKTSSIVIPLGTTTYLYSSSNVAYVNVDYNDRIRDWRFRIQFPIKYQGNHHPAPMQEFLLARRVEPFFSHWRVWGKLQFTKVKQFVADFNEVEVLSPKSTVFYTVGNQNNCAALCTVYSVQFW